MMADFIANMIEKARRGGVAAGQAKYYAYFHPVTWRQYKDAVDQKLIQRGCGDCICEID